VQFRYFLISEHMLEFLDSFSHSSTLL